MVRLNLGTIEAQDVDFARNTMQFAAVEQRIVNRGLIADHETTGTITWR
jgi:hypothetical protein